MVSKIFTFLLLLLIHKVTKLYSCRLLVLPWVERGSHTIWLNVGSFSVDPDQIIRYYVTSWPTREEQTSTYKDQPWLEWLHAKCMMTHIAGNLKTNRTYTGFKGCLWLQVIKFFSFFFFLSGGVYFISIKSRKDKGPIWTQSAPSLDGSLTTGHDINVRIRSWQNMIVWTYSTI